ncbi:NAD(P)H-dependent oxidoreductase [Virgisporangium ochraceum]|uniref:FMN reductase n=1 Tax=Virgisporangium ochraceum TaxID=65505 RepID=A0A8J3ZKH3_9ACTN|nr:NAD(P)H-dependent oxidoreductase [Virgisporangium ochraceum]GIJ65989.1 FMN reductase [Virgisporangium ochraceum]
MDKQPLRVAVVTQEDQVGAWVAGQARQRGGVEVGLIGTADPAFAARLACAEAFVLVTPAVEVPVRLREAIVAGYAEWRAKPVAFVAYGTGSGALEQLRCAFAGLHVVTVGPGLTALDPVAFTAMFEQLEWWGRALRDRIS